MGVWSNATDGWDSSLEYRIGSSAVGSTGVYHAYQPPDWEGQTGFYHSDLRSLPAPDETRTWDTLYLWAAPTYSGGDTMYFALEPDGTNPPPGNRQYFLELTAVPDGVTGAPPVGTVWQLPLQAFTLDLPTFRTTNGLEGYRFTLTFDEVVSIPGDFDKDGDVDEDDFYEFEQCYTGPDAGPIGPDCGPGDFDGDDDIDCDDWDMFLVAWTEPEDPPALPICDAVCGDGTVEEGETCDTAIPPGEPGACPTDCDTGDPCILGELLSPGTCTARCELTEITEPAHGDGCCPAGANSINDHDCEPFCGNTVCEEGEETGCPSDCQCTEDSECQDEYVCTLDRCLDNVCTHTPTTYGEVDCNGTINVFDVFCILDGIAGDFIDCSFANDDIHPCRPNGVLNIFDVFAVLDAIAGIDPCCSPGACCLPDDSCVDVDRGLDCSDLSGDFAGSGTTCATTTCPLP